MTAPVITAQAYGGGSYELHEEGEWFPGTITSIEEASQPNQWGKIDLYWTVKLDEGDSDGFDPRFRTSQSLHPKSNLVKYLKWIEGSAWTAPAPGEVVDLNDYVGRRIDVMFERYEKILDDGSTVERESIARVRGGKGGKPTTVRENAIQRNNRKAAENDDDAPF